MSKLSLRLAQFLFASIFYFRRKGSSTARRAGCRSGALLTFITCTPLPCLPGGQRGEPGPLGCWVARLYPGLMPFRAIKAIIPPLLLFMKKVLSLNLGKCL
jgi:hypothetical protein